MKVAATSLPEVKIITSTVHKDFRGYFLESYQKEKLAEYAGIEAAFVQDNLSHSIHGVIRGLHYQLQRPQGKLVMVVRGAVFDVAVDLRKSSSSFG
jgi:dTDP-4-dehydrorhamnose 3,5-epimerase